MSDRIRKRCMLLIVTVMFVVMIAVPATITRAALVTSDVIEDGTNKTEWEYDRGTKTLIISGKGEMLTASGDKDWKNLSATQKVIVKEGITTVADNAFCDMDKLVSVELPGGITVIKQSAFQSCDMLSTVNIPSSVTIIGDYAFAWCNQLKNASIPDKVEVIGNYAFTSCWQLKDVVIPKSVKSIGEWAFSDVDGLVSLTIPDGIEKIEDYTFNSCDGLRRVFLPESVTDIATHAFDNDINAIFYCNNQDQMDYFELKDLTYFDASEKHEFTSDNLTIEVGSAVWNGSSVVPSFTYKLNDINILLVEGEDYTAVYKDNVAVGTATATIKGNGMFEGEVTKTFTISKADISCSPCFEMITFDVTLDGEIIWSSTSSTPMNKIPFDGKKHTFGITNVKYNGIPLTEGTDYRLDNYAKDIISSSGCIYINGLKNLTGCRYVDIPGIETISIDDLTLEQLTESVTYNMQEQRPKFKVSYGDYEFPEESINYTWLENINANWNSNWIFTYADKGTIELTINGVQGSKTFSYEIKSADISKATIRFSDEKYYSNGKDNPATPIPEVTYQFNENEGDYLLNCGTDYTITYKNNIETGTATALIEGIGNYTGSKEIEFEVEKDALIESYEITLEKDSYTFTGKEIRPVVKEVKVNGEVWDSSEYNVLYDNFVNAGSAWLTISGKGEYEKFSAQKQFTITPLSVDDCEFIVKDVAIYSESDTAYPDYELKYNGVSVLDGYTWVNIDCENNVGYGTGKATFTFGGNVEGTKTEEFQIKKPLFDSWGWEFEENVPFYEYTGNELTPKIKVIRYDSEGSKTLTEGKDYELSYRDNVEIGTGYITITAIGQYAGSTEISFAINRSNNVTYDKINKVLTISGEGEMKISKLPEYSQLAEKVIVEEGITTIANSVFYEFTRLKDVELPDTLISIGDGAFNSCRSLTHLKIPDSVEEIRSSAFWDCNNLKTINIPTSMKTIGEYAFAYTGVEKVVIPDNIKTIRQYAFSSCYRLESVVVSPSVTKIEDYAFRWCNSLKKVSLPKELSNAESIGLKTFEDTSSELIVYCNSDYQVDYCEQYDIRHIDARKGYQLTNDNVGFYQNYGSVNYVGGETKIALSCNGVKLIEGVDYDAVYENADKVGTANVTITGKGVYTGIVEKSYYIDPADIWYVSKDVYDDTYKGDFDINVDDELWDGNTVTFEGKQHTLKISDLWYMDEENILAEGVDYEATISGDGYSSLYCYIEGKGNYKGSFGFNIDLEQIDINRCDVSLELPASVTYTSKEQKPKFKVTYKDFVFPEGAYGVSWKDDAHDKNDFTSAYSGKVMIGTGYYDSGNPHPTLCGTLNDEFDYEIVPLDISQGTVSFSKEQYVLDPNSNIPYIGYFDINIKVGDIVTSVDKTGCSVEYKNNNSPGMATVTITGTGNCTGQVSAKFKVVKDIAACKAIVTNKEQVYTGKEILAEVTVDDNGVLLEKAKDYTLSYSNNIEEGTATVVMEGQGYYYGKRELNFEIYKNDISTAEMKFEYDSVLYDGKEKCPSVTVLYEGKVLKLGEDYEVSYSNNIDMGKATAIVNGKGSFKNTLLKQFDIYKYKMQEVNVEADQSSYTYDGSVHTPIITVKHNGVVLKQDSDYKLTIGSETEAGEYKATIEGMGQYTGSVDFIYTIEPIVLDNADVTLKDTIFTYDGSAKKPSVTVLHNGNTLVADQDYQLSYKNNIDEGTAYAVIDGINNYSGHIEVSFTILAYQSGMDAVYKEKDTLLDEEFVYHIINEEDKEVEFTAPADNKETNVVVPATITAEDGTVYTVTSIGEKAFYKNTNIKKLTIANTVKSIENYAFYGCKNLTTVKIGNGIDVVGDSSFRQCTKLTSITLPKSVDKIGKNCFYGCKKLKTITIKSNQVVDVQKNAVKGVSKKCVIKVPKKLIKKYKKEFDKKSGFLKTMKIKKS